MEESFDQKYSKMIDAIRDFDDFEARGDEIFLKHEDPMARLIWAFHRPTGAAMEQIRDPDPLVSAMGFNRARNSALERYRMVHPDVLSVPSLRARIQSKSRMLFRAMADENFDELVQVLKEFPDYLPLALNQIVNGRRWKENHADMIHASHFLEISLEQMDEKTLTAFKDRLEQIEADWEEERVLELIEQVKEKNSQLHPVVREHFFEQIRSWAEKNNLHPLKKILLENKLKEII